MALIPEAISFSIIAGVDPRVGLYASFTMAVAISFTGGRPAMISAATGAMALVVVSLVADHGVEYLLAATVLAGLLQVVLGALGIAKLMRFVPRSVMTGFVNALAILIFMAQLPHLTAGGITVVVLVAAGLAIMILLPRVTTAIPAPLVAIVLLTGLTVAVAIGVPTVGDEGTLPETLPLLGIPAVPLTLATLEIIAPYALTLAAVGLIESLLTARLVDDITETGSDKYREARGQGIANVITGFFGGMASCAMIGQTMIVMILVAASTFDWHSIAPATLKRMPRGETAIMVVTVAVTVVTHNLAIGVAIGVLTAMAVFARRVSHLVDVERIEDPEGTAAIYSVSGELFFASDQELVDWFDYPNDPKKVIIDLSRAHIWDASAVAALDAITEKYAARGVDVEITGLNHHSEALHRNLSGQVAAAH